ncbi:hypothetical protein MUNTM_35190 [Mycobacterium sp. MUNTM1]
MQIRDHAGSQRPALILHPSVITVSFAELESRANPLARFVRKAGLAEGDCIAVLMETMSTSTR